MTRLHPGSRARRKFLIQRHHVCWLFETTSDDIQAQGRVLKKRHVRGFPVYKYRYLLASILRPLEPVIPGPVRTHFCFVVVGSSRICCTVRNWPSPGRIEIRAPLKRREFCPECCPVQVFKPTQLVTSNVRTGLNTISHRENP